MIDHVPIRIFRAALLAGFACVAGVSTARADLIDLVTNGNFGQVNMPGGLTQITPTNVVGWSSPGGTNGYNFIFNAATANSVGSYIPEYGHNVALYGQDGANSAFTSPLSSGGGNFVGADGAYQVGALTQTINGLQAGATYALNFAWAGAQQTGFTGATTEQWHVSLGSQTISTAVVNNASHGLTPWMQETFVYTATSSSEVLSFLANGTPGGEPPFVLLAGVSMYEVPEPTVGALLLAGLLGLGLARRGARWQHAAV